MHTSIFIFCLFFNDTATTEIYTYWHTLSLHDALPIYGNILRGDADAGVGDDEESGALDRIVPPLDRHRPAGRGELQRVGDNIDQHLLKAPLIGAQRRKII